MAVSGRLPLAQRKIVPHNWWLMAPLMAVGLLLVGLSALAWPSLPVVIAGILSVGLAAVGRMIVDFEHEMARNHLRHIGIKLVSLGLPMVCFGFAVTGWTELGETSDWGGAIGILIIVSGLATTLLNGRLAAIMMVQVGIWLGVALEKGNLQTYLVLLFGLALAIYLSIRQQRLDLLEEARRSEADRAQARAEEILADYEQTGQGWFWETDRRGAITYISAPICAQVGRSQARLLGRPFTQLFILDTAGNEGERTLNFHLSARSSFQDLAVRAAIEAEERWWSISGRPIYDSFNNFIGFRGSGNDLTERRRSEENASRLAHYDSLTGLANRHQMSQTLEKILHARHIEHRHCTVFLLDLDRFKQVNDTLGHPAGDALLKQVAQRLERTVDSKGRVGRLGGDEFQVVLVGRHQQDDLAKLAERVIENLSQPYSIDGHRVVIGASVGIARAPTDGNSSEEIIRNADLALYAAKDAGRGRYHFYAEDLHSDAQERRQLEQDLRDALAHGGLSLAYQPVVHTTTERITGFEALLRWNHPVNGPMSPAKFIPVAEDTGLIAQIGEWALRTACADLAKWPESVRVAVNVSPLQFANPALPAIVTSALASAQVDPSRLELEITESVFLNDDAGTDAMFQALKRVGVRLALDDFGTGYSSLGYLKKAPFDKIKIDQSFVRGATITGSRNGAIIASIVSMAEALGMETTAEGVETLDELDLVRMLGCSHVQGYIYEKPMDIISATAKLEQGLNAIARGPKSARATRQTMLRKVVLDHGGERYNGTIRNISITGALVEGLWNVPPGTIFEIYLAEGHVVTATCRWCQDDRMGVEFASPLAVDQQGRIAIMATHGRRGLETPLRKAS